MKLLKLFTLGALIAMASAVPKLDTFDPLTPHAKLDLINCGNCMDALNACYQAQGCWNSFVGGSANQANCISWCQQAICVPCPSCAAAIGNPSVCG